MFSMLALQAFRIHCRLDFDVEMGESKSFDVAIGPNQIMPSCHFLNYAWIILL